MTTMDPKEKEEAEKARGWSKAVSNEELLCTPIEETLFRLENLHSGPTTEQAEKLFEICGHNEVARKEKRAAVVKSVLQFKNPLVLILLFAARATTATVLRDNVKKQARSQIDPEY